MRDPIDNPENIMAERVVENAIPYARAILADAIPELLWEAAKEAADDHSPIGEWEDWYLDNKEQIIESIYDELFYQAKKLWEE